MKRTREVMAAESRKLSGARVGIPARRMDFDFPAGPGGHLFCDGNAVASALFAAMSAAFPPGERFFVDSVRRYRERITDPTLRAQVSGFMGQESVHGRQHERLNAWLAARGFDMDRPERLIRVGIRLLRKLPPSQQLACTTFCEHFTALLAEQLLTDEAFRSKVDPELLPLWTWHALEELEHKAVAFDVHREVSPNEHLERVLAAPLVLAVLLPVLGVAWTRLVLEQGDVADLRAHRRGLRLLFGPDGFMTRILPRMPDYLAARFHPSQHDTAALERTWRDRLFGEEGELLVAFRNRDAVEAAARSGAAG